MDAESVKSRHDLARFVDTLREDLGRHPEQWENHTLDSFLEALAAFARDVPGYYRNASIDVDSNEPSWRLFADLLAGARVYE